LAPLLVFTGATLPDGAQEAEVRADLARSLGVPPDRIVTVAGARNTREEALRVAAALGPRGARRILLVTDELHLVRARRLFELAGFEVLPAPTGEHLDEAEQPGPRVGLGLPPCPEGPARPYHPPPGYAAEPWTGRCSWGWPC